MLVAIESEGVAVHWNQGYRTNRNISGGTTRRRRKEGKRKLTIKGMVVEITGLKYGSAPDRIVYLILEELSLGVG